MLDRGLLQAERLAAAEEAERLAQHKQGVASLVDAAHAARQSTETWPPEADVELRGRLHAAERAADHVVRHSVGDVLVAQAVFKLTDDEHQLINRLGPSDDPLGYYIVQLSIADRRTVYGLLKRLEALGSLPSQ